MADCRHLLPDCKVLKQGEEVTGVANGIEGLVFPPEPPPLPHTDSRYDRLYRSSDERVLLGLCGGLAHRWGVPALLVRAGMVILLGVMVGWAYPFSVVFPALPTKDVRSPRQR
jgi:phage shock protein PspC (stress-responsive transcriptional regulator)